MKTPDLLLAIKPVINATNRASERQWMDILGVIKVQCDSLDKDYLRHWSESLGLSDLMKQAFLDGEVEF